MDPTQERIENFNKIERLPVENIDQLISPLSQSLYRWWSGFNPKLPARADFDITQHRDLPSNIFLVEVLDNGNFHYRLHGELVTQLVGRSSQHIVFNKDSDLLDDRLLAEHLGNVIQARTAFQCHGDLSVFNRDYIRFESLDCPLANEEGRITHILGVLTDIK